MGSALFLASWAVMMGPMQYAQHLISGPRLPFTAAYFGSITLTLVFAIKVGVAHPISTALYRLQIPFRTPTQHLPSLVYHDFLGASADQSLT